MGDMAIAAMSVNMNMAKTQQDFGMGVLKMTMDTAEQMVAETLEDMTAAVSLDPNLGANIDVRA